MFEIKEAFEMNSEFIKTGSHRYIDDVACRYITAANAEIQRLQSQPATFDDVPWEPVDYESLVRSEDGLYQFQHNDGDVKLWMRGEALWVTTCFRARDDNEMQNWYKSFRKLPVALYTPAPEKPKRYEVVRPDKSVCDNYVKDCKNGLIIAGHLCPAQADTLCDKLNRLEELEAKE